MQENTSNTSGEARPYKSVLLKKHPRVRTFLENAAPTYQALLASGQAQKKRDWVAKKKEDVVEQFGKKELVRYKADDIRAVSMHHIF